MRRVIPCDAACLLRLEGAHLVPVAGFGLSGRALSRRYDRREHPRLDVILRSRKPVRFPPSSLLADPFDGEIDASCTSGRSSRTITCTRASGAR